MKSEKRNVTSLGAKSLFTDFTTVVILNSSDYNISLAVLYLYLKG